MALENTIDNTSGKSFLQHRNDGCSGFPLHCSGSINPVILKKTNQTKKPNTINKKKTPKQRKNKLTPATNKHHQKNPKNKKHPKKGPVHSNMTLMILQN